MLFNTTILFMDRHVNPDGRIVKILLLMIIDLMAIFGNVLFLFAACYKQSLRSQSRTYIYFSYVSLTSLTTSMFVIPFPIVSMVSKRWVFGSQLCYFNGFMTSFCLTSCIYSITVLSIHKYMSVVLPMKRQFTNGQTFYHCTISFMLSLVITIIPFAESQVYFNPMTGMCAIYFLKRKTFYTMFVVCACYAIPTMINITIYIKIFKALRRHRRRLQFNTFYNPASVIAQRQTINTMYMTFGSYIIGWTPFFVYAVLYLTGHIQTGSYLLVVAYIFGFSNSAANPLIFIFRNMRIQNSWSSVFRKRQVPKVKLISSLSKYGFAGHEPTTPCIILKDDWNKSSNNREFFSNDYVDVDNMVTSKCNEFDTKKIIGDKGTLFRTSSTAFNYASTKSFTFKGVETFC